MGADQWYGDDSGRRAGRYSADTRHHQQQLIQTAGCCSTGQLSVPTKRYGCYRATVHDGSPHDSVRPPCSASGHGADFVHHIGDQFSSSYPGHGRSHRRDSDGCLLSVFNGQFPANRGDSEHAARDISRTWLDWSADRIRRWPAHAELLPIHLSVRRMWMMMRTAWLESGSIRIV